MHTKTTMAALALSVLTSFSATADVTSFAAVRDSSLPESEYLAGAYSYTQAQQRGDSGIAVANIATGNAKSQTLQGINRVAVDNNAPVDDAHLREHSIGGPFSVAISVWADQFTITGGSGVGQTAVSALVTGEFGPKADPSYGGGGAYYLFVANAAQVSSILAKPFEFIVANTASMPSTLRLEQNVLTPGYTDPGTSLPPGSSFGGTLTGQIDFTYGESFYLVSALAGYANDYGILNAFNTAVFGITAPAGALISTDSGSMYAAAVPEPQTYIMFLVGIGCLYAVGKRRHSNYKSL